MPPRVFALDNLTADNRDLTSGDNIVTFTYRCYNRSHNSEIGFAFSVDQGQNDLIIKGSLDPNNWYFNHDVNNEWTTYSLTVTLTVNKDMSVRATTLVRLSGNNELTNTSNDTEILFFNPS